MSIPAKIAVFMKHKLYDYKENHHEIILFCFTCDQLYLEVNGVDTVVVVLPYKLCTSETV